LYLPRSLGIGLASISVAGALYQRGAPLWAYPLLAASGLGWPHFARRRASRSPAPVRTEHQNVQIDAAFCGFWVALTCFNVAPIFLLLIMLSVTIGICDQRRVLLGSLVALVLGLAFGSALDSLENGAHMEFFARPLTRLTCVPFLLVYPMLIGALLGSARSRAARDAALAEQSAAQARLTNLLATSPTVLYAMEYDGERWRCVEITENLLRLTGYTVTEAMAPGWWDQHIHPEDFDLAQRAAARVVAGERVVCHYRIAHKCDGYLWLQDEFQLLPATAEHPARIVGAWLDVTEKRQAKADIHRLAFYDTLTGLANRELLQLNLGQSFFASRLNSEIGGLMFIGLDNFKAVNEVHGHSIGDQVLVKIGRRLARCLRQSDTVARLGGDEFAVLLPRLGADQETATARAIALAAKLTDAIDLTMNIDQLSLQITASIGISLFQNQQSIEQILREADLAMYVAKATMKNRAWPGGRSNVAVFDIAMQDTVTRRHRIENEIQEALAEHRFELWLQRQVDCTGKTIGAEALIRLRRPDGRIIFPDDFISVSEESGLIAVIGQWVRKEACQLLARMTLAQLPRLSINVSAIEFRQPRFADEILADLTQAGVDPARLTLEITESLLIDQLEETIAKLHQLTDRGIRISIDDFGTGYSSLAYLQRLPISEIKIDKRFVREMLDDVRSARLTQSLVMLARKMEFDVIAEGVETREQENLLVRHGCNNMQGYLFGRPEPVGKFLAPTVIDSEPVSSTLL
jgi:diguanylate cyclase (GGDEF)-like protein